MFWDVQMECMDRERLLSIQRQRLRDAVRHAYNNVAHYKKVFDERGLKPDDIREPADLQRLPLTDKETLRENYPYGMFAVPLQQISRIHASSGTTGRATVVGYTREDLDTWAECVARVVCAAGVTEEDIVQISFGYGLFTGALGLHYGLEKVGCAIIPVSSGNTERQINIMRDYKPTALVATPSYALYMAETAKAMNALDEICLRIGLFGSEPSTEEMRQRIEATMPGISATDNYGMSELMGPGVAGECTEKSGQHLWEDHFVPEIINPDTGEVLPIGAEGELVITTLTKKAFPVVRYRTHDITHFIEEPCACGRTHIRIAKLKGRSDDMLIIRGVNVFPSQIESIIASTEGITPHHEIIVSRENFLDQIEVLVELESSDIVNDYRKVDGIRIELQNKMRTMLGLDVKITLVSPNTLQRFEGKARRVKDERGKL